MAGEILLVVDDHPTNLKLLRVALTAEGYDVRTAMNAEEALAILAEVRPELILMDLQLPGMDGLQLTRNLKDDPAFASIPVLAITSYAMKGDRDRAMAAGCDAYITKPVDTRALPSIVSELLEKSRAEAP